MSKRLVTASLILAGAIHLLPMAGAIGPDRLTALYGLDFAEPNLSILMRHRAVMFGLVGGLLLWAAFRPALRAPAFAAGLVSTASFLVLAWSTGGYNPLLGRVVLADIIAVLVLLCGGGLSLFTRRVA